jgi:alpha-beta hydrolase superfamily lysophospholipase
MDPFCEFLGELGLHSYRITLTGHNEPNTEVFDETVWVDDVTKAYKEVRAEFPNLPTYVVGYSLGGLLVTHALDGLSMDPLPHGLVLLAPAISLRPPLALLAEVGLPPALSWSVPNIAPDLYRRYPITPLFWYSNTLTLSDATQMLQHSQRLKEIPTLIALNPDDELISESGTTEWIILNNLAPEWTTLTIHKDTEGQHLPEHVIVDERSLGTVEWQQMRGTIREFITRQSVLVQ